MSEVTKWLLTGCLIGALSVGPVTPLSVAQTPEHRIGIRKTTDFAEFYDVETDQTFIPRGTNYVELRYDPTGSYLMSGLFLPGFHDPADVELDLERMRALGYNTARIFVDLCREELCIGDPAGGLRDDVMDNVVSLLHRAKRHGIFILFTANWLPDFGGYLDAHERCRPTFDHGNCLLLSRAGVDAYKDFFTDFVQGLLDRAAPTDQILGYQLRNEAFFENNAPPLNWTSDEVVTANGETYNMASEDDKIRMIEDGLVHWANEVAAVIKNLDPTALVGAGFFPPSDPHDWRPGDYRLVRTERILKESALDFLDFHGYPGEGLTMDQLVENYGMVGFEDKPILFGEFGPFLHSYDSPAVAARAMQAWQAQACQTGFDGFLYWLWDPDKAPRVGDSVWGVHDGEGEIARATAPVFQPDPCAEGIIPNLALGKPATASQSLTDRPPSGAFDGNIETGWGAGSEPPEWIEVDLGAPATIGRMSLAVDQFPAGHTVHRVSGQATPTGPVVLLHEFSGSTNFGHWLEFAPDEPWSGFRFIRVTTTESPSWVAWFEIEIYPPDSSVALPLPPNLAHPAPFEENLTTTPTISWSAVAAADAYHLQVADSNTFDNVVFEPTGLTQTSATLDAVPDNKDYYWRVRALNSDGPGPWSATRRFTVGNVAHVDVSGSQVPYLSRLVEVFPNPSTDGTTFKLSLQRSAWTRITVFDVRGRIVSTVDDGFLSHGEHLIRWNPGHAPSGVYLYHVDVDGNVETGRIIHLSN